jgi:hypothetical protein
VGLPLRLPADPSHLVGSSGWCLLGYTRLLVISHRCVVGGTRCVMLSCRVLTGVGCCAVPCQRVVILDWLSSSLWGVLHLLAFNATAGLAMYSHYRGQSVQAWPVTAT